MHDKSRYILFLLITIGITIAISAYLTLVKSVTEQSRLQQESVTRAFELVSTEIMTPLNISMTLAKTHPVAELMDAPMKNQAQIQAQLEELDKRLGMRFFAANERNRLQLFSNKPPLAMKPTTTEWYFRLKDKPGRVHADIGNRVNPEIFFDIKVYNQQQEFLGFLGIAKELSTFIHKFAEFRQRFGYDLYLVNDAGKVVMSTDESIPWGTNPAALAEVANLHWYQGIDATLQGAEQAKNIVVDDSGKEYLVARLGLDEMRWRIYILTPLSPRQAALARTFAGDTVKWVGIITLLFALMWGFNAVLQRYNSNRRDLDNLTGLPTRARLKWFFNNRLNRGDGVSCIVMDADYFKRINDNHGHNAGDQVLCALAETIKEIIRDEDLAVRWGGEEFLLLLPGTNLAAAKDIAERARKTIEGLAIVYGGVSITVTASFGVSHSASTTDFDSLFEAADKALYRAKAAGRNCVRTAA